jgi:hypothetical protein
VDSSEKRDLTQLLDLPQAEPPPDQDAAFSVEQPPLESIDHFENLDELPPLEWTEEPEAPNESGLPESPSFSKAELDTFESSPATDEGMPLTEPILDNWAEIETPSEATSEIESAPTIEFQSESFLETPPSTPEFDRPSDSAIPPLPNFETDLTSDAQESLPALASPQLSSLKDSLKQNQRTHFQSIDAAYPFHLRITGHLEPHLISRLERWVDEFSLGLTKSELDLQIASGRIFIPRISEYAGIYLIQNLRDSEADFSLLPADTEFEDAMSDPREKNTITHGGRAHPALEIPLYFGNHVDLGSQSILIDSIECSTLLEIYSPSPENTRVFREAQQELEREMRFKAYYRGADALYRAEISTEPMGLPSQVRITLRALAVKTAQS